MVLVGMGIDTQKAGYLQKDYGSGGGGDRHSESRDLGKYHGLVRVGLDRERWDLGKDLGSGGGGDRHLESWGPGEGSWFWWWWG